MNDDNINREQESSLPPAPAPVPVPMPAITDRDLNVLKGVSEWLLSRAMQPRFANDLFLMREWSKSLARIHDKLAPIAVAKPVTFDELFGKLNHE